MDGPSEIAVGGPDFSFRKRADGGFTITQRGAVNAPIVLDHLLIGRKYLPALRSQRHLLRISFGGDLSRLSLARRGAVGPIPVRARRTMDPPVDTQSSGSAT